MAPSPRFATGTPETDPAWVRPRLRRLALTAARDLSRAEAPPALRVGGARGTGRSTLLAAIREHPALADHAVAWLDAAELPEGADVVGTAVGLVLGAADPEEGPARHRRVHTLRFPTLRATRAPSHDQVLPSPTAPTARFSDELREALDRPVVLLVDDLDDVTPAGRRALLRQLPMLQRAGVRPVLATADDDALSRKRLPHRIELDPLDGDETRWMLQRWSRAEGVGWSSATQDALEDAASWLPRTTPRALATALTRLHRTLVGESAADTAASDPGRADAELATWALAGDAFPRLDRALSTRDDRWWHDLRLAVDQALRRRPDPLVDDLLADPRATAWVRAHLPSPQARHTAFPDHLARWRHARQRLAAAGQA